MKNNKLTMIIFCILIFSGCSTTHQVVKTETNQVKTMPEIVPVQIIYEEKIVYVDKPVYMPEEEIKTIINKSKSSDAAEQSITDATQIPAYWQGGQMIYDYDESFLFHVYTQPLIDTDIQFEPGEIIIGNPICGDTLRWEISAGLSKQNGMSIQHLYINPHDPGLVTSLIINTDRRQYYMLIKSFKDKYMMAVKWNYPGIELLNIYANSSFANDSATGTNMNVGNICTDYLIEYKNKNTYFIPESVFDDGKKTFIVFPDDIVHKKFPAAHYKDGELLNFRVERKTIIIDKLITEVVLSIEKEAVIVKKIEE